MIFIGRWEDYIDKIPPYHLVVTDPPYGATPQHWDRRPEWKTLLESLFCYGLPTAQLWMFVRMPWAIEVYEAAKRAGWIYKQELIWKKQNAGGCTSRSLRKVHENLWHFVKKGSATYNGEALRSPKTTKGDKSVADRGSSTTQHFSEVGGGQYVDDGYRLQTTVAEIRNLHRSPESLGHPTQKPLALLRIPIIYSSNPGDTVLDPFAGTGSTVACAKMLGRCGIGMESDEHWAIVAKERCSARR